MTEQSQAVSIREALQESQVPMELMDGVEAALMYGDIGKLSDKQRIQYYVSLCMSLGLNPLTRPFGFMKDQDGKVLPYARKECAEQLRKRHRVSTKILSREWMDDLYIITVEATMPDGRSEESQGIVAVNSKGQARANEMMKAETKAKRRATLSLIGLGLDLGEETVHEMRFDLQTGAFAEENTRQLPIMAQTKYSATEAAFGDNQRREHIHHTADTPRQDDAQRSKADKRTSGYTTTKNTMDSENIKHQNPTGLQQTDAGPGFFSESTDASADVPQWKSTGAEAVAQAEAILPRFSGDGRADGLRSLVGRWRSQTEGRESKPRAGYDALVDQIQQGTRRLQELAEAQEVQA